MLLPTRNVHICEDVMSPDIIASCGPQMVHNPNGPQMVHFYVLSTNYTKKLAHSILKRRNKVNLIQMVHKWYTFTSIPLIILKKQVTAYYNKEIK